MARGIRYASSVVLGLGLALAALPATAQNVGNVASLKRLVEIGRAGSWQAAAIGDGVAVGDSLRTDEQGRARLAFADGSVVILSGRSQIVIDESVYRPDDGSVSSVFEVLKGKIRAIVSEYYETSGTFEVRTPNSVSGVRGTDFIVVHDEISGNSEVVGVSGHVVVRGVAKPDVTVEVTARKWTQVAPGEAPTEPTTLSDERFRYYLDGFDFVGSDGPESLLFNEPALVEGAVPEPDRPGGSHPSEAQLDLDELPSEPGEINPDGSGIAGEPPAAIDAGDLGVRF